MHAATCCHVSNNDKTVAHFDALKDGAGADWFLRYTGKTLGGELGMEVTVLYKTP